MFRESLINLAIAHAKEKSAKSHQIEVETKVLSAKKNVWKLQNAEGFFISRIRLEKRKVEAFVGW